MGEEEMREVGASASLHDLLGQGSLAASNESGAPWASEDR